MPLQKRITSFSADESFGNAVKKIKEHYNIDIQRSTVRNISEKHAHMMLVQKKQLHKHYASKSRPANCIIGQIDGSMVPIVETDQNQSDKRKNKKHMYREARLSLAYPKGKIDPFYNATLGSTEKAGKQLVDCVKTVGQTKKSRIHCVGDGAPWIVEQISARFGSDATYLIDFYHLSEYIAAAAACCKPEAPREWGNTMKEHMKANNYHILIAALERHMEEVAQKGEDHVCGALRCYNYIVKRTDQINYKGAIEEDLPIGSGKVEGGHKSVIQKRMKLSGAWWTEDNVEAMLTLRTVIANGLWDRYWQAYSG